MCGIAGIVGLGHGDRRDTAVGRMTAALSHRGPDGEGFFQCDSVSLGHRRLSIIDPANGRQPLTNEDGTVWLTYNGEIYNFRELKELLVSAGHRFKTNCDSEVIVHAYEQWGPNCVERFRGMFAFALIDQNKQTVLIARDQLGIKPLYYRCHNGYVAFASELPALLYATEKMPPVSLRAIEFFLRYRYIPAPDTAYESIYKLPPATYQVYDFAGNQLRECEYWKLSFQPDTRRLPHEWLQSFEEVLMDSVRAHLVADVSFGAFLSGGVDSTLIVSCMSQLLNRNITAYTIWFDEEQFSERRFASEAASRLGIELRHEVVQPDVVDTLQRLFTNYGEPFADTSAVPTWWISELASRDVPMILSGDGADEAFAGYHRYRRWLDDSFVADAKSFLKYPKRLVRRLNELCREGFVSSRVSRWERNFIGILDRSRRMQLWKPEFQELLDESCPAFAKAGQEAKGLDKLSFAQSIDIKTYLPGDILTKVDIASMRHGLEVRTPFTDIRVMEFAATLPTHEKCGPQGRSQRMKALPKRFLNKTFPDDFVNRKKMGFAIPEAAWLAKGNPVRSCFDDLTTRNSTLFDYFERETLSRMTSEYDHRGVHATPLWSIFSLVLWLDQLQAVKHLGTAA